MSFQDIVPDRILLVSATDGAAELARFLRACGYDVAAVSRPGEGVPPSVEGCAELVVISGAPGAEPAARRDLGAGYDDIPVLRLLNEAESEPGEPAPDRSASLRAPYTQRELRTTIDLMICRNRVARTVHELDGFFSVSIDMFCFLDYNGYFRRLNPAWERTLGFTPAEMMAKPFIEFVHPDDRERTLVQNRDVRGGGQARGFSNRYLCKDGTYRWLLWNSAPAVEERTIYAVARDITARKLADDERERLVGELQSSLTEVRSLREILPICSYCRKIRDDDDYWESVESYISRHTRSRFSHGICPSCMATQVEPMFGPEEPV
ncbi:PAS domain S-box protein [Longimicrobium terrae]|uniref:PAS domain S-box-containing protein n=1 Tax=Longimicrobium terrae TaxID=1639882 RepID=A0A841H3V1_9BACT|nr:PAS domain S-box-containing protein [Longimicrobium terrae]MBB6072479.1 PAS domain S-box-containing protein [Longimicrobium terrae]NNC32110.1 PAS domain S-box protein [Longimicrobium terrae]